MASKTESFVLSEYENTRGEGSAVQRVPGEQGAASHPLFPRAPPPPRSSLRADKKRMSSAEEQRIDALTKERRKKMKYERLAGQWRYHGEQFSGHGLVVTEDKKLEFGLDVKENYLKRLKVMIEKIESLCNLCYDDCLIHVSFGALNMLQSIVMNLDFDNHATLLILRDCFLKKCNMAAELLAVTCVDVTYALLCNRDHYDETCMPIQVPDVVPYTIYWPLGKALKNPYSVFFNDPEIPENEKKQLSHKVYSILKDMLRSLFMYHHNFSEAIARAAYFLAKRQPGVQESEYTKYMRIFEAEQEFHAQGPTDIFYYYYMRILKETQARIMQGQADELSARERQIMRRISDLNIMRRVHELTQP